MIQTDRISNRVGAPPNVQAFRGKAFRIRRFMSKFLGVGCLFGFCASKRGVLGNMGPYPLQTPFITLLFRTLRAKRKIPEIGHLCVELFVCFLVSELLKNAELKVLQLTSRAGIRQTSLDHLAALHLTPRTEKPSTMAPQINNKSELQDA